MSKADPKLHRLLTDSAEHTPDALAYGPVRYGPLVARAARLAGTLRATGVGRGDRVALALDGCVEYLDADSYLYISGRDSEMICTGGHLVGPQEVEDAITALPRHKVPSEVLFTDALPHSDRGKLLRSVVRASLEGKRAGAAVEEYPVTVNRGSWSPRASWSWCSSWRKRSTSVSKALRSSRKTSTAGSYRELPG